jgi:hypothetical protein
LSNLSATSLYSLTLSEDAYSFADAIALNTDEFGVSFSGSGVGSLTTAFGSSSLSTTTAASWAWALTGSAFGASSGSAALS